MNDFETSSYLGYTRCGWTEAAQEVRAEGDDKLILGDSPNEFENEEWTW
ncbi:hypothetical protein [Dyadobacter arcticus]|uniref:Uncharacterized protein n=1 Tax=Dyadobacter arcticus TaxID=1078754 RepID=A0ABX0UGX7_9BACT|nr:hypothetical protein [Dyadobacter arcticus]NIJ52262.1 hypothetical protein [Dyadobacter arcticus]